MQKNTSHEMQMTIWPQYLKAYRKAQGWTQSALAERLGVSRDAVAKWEAGKRQPPAYLKIALEVMNKL